MTSSWFFLIFFLVSACWYNSVGGDTTPSLDILTVDCTGGIQFYPKTNLESLVNLSTTAMLYDWVHTRLFDRLQTVCPSLTIAEFRQNYAWMTPDFWFYAMSGNNTNEPSPCPLFDNSTTGMNLKKMKSSLQNMELILPENCTASNCSLKYEWDTDYTLLLSIKPCMNANGTQRYWNFFSLSCQGAGCNNTGMFCQNDSECGPGLNCTYLSDFINMGEGFEDCQQQQQQQKRAATKWDSLKSLATVVFGPFANKPSNLLFGANQVIEGAEDIEEQKRSALQDCNSSTVNSTYSGPQLDTLLRDMNLYDSGDKLPLPCESSAQFFGYFINFQRKLFNNSLNFNTTSSSITWRFCSPPANDFLTGFFNNSCYVSFDHSSSTTILNCSNFTIWNGKLASGEMVDSSNRRSGNLGINQPVAHSTFSDSINETVVRVFSAQCDGSIVAFPDGNTGAILQAIAMITARAGTPPAAGKFLPNCPNQNNCTQSNDQQTAIPTDPRGIFVCNETLSGYCAQNQTDQSCFWTVPCKTWVISQNSSASYDPFTIAMGASALASGVSMNLAQLRPMLDLTWSALYNHSKCRAQARGGSLTEAQFKIRWAYLMDFVLYLFTGTAVSQPVTAVAMGTPLSDFTSNFTNNIDMRVEMPSTCTYNNWIENNDCGVNYTGLEVLLKTESSLRLYAKQCPGGNFTGPEIYIDCVGSFCKLLTQFTLCNSDSDCAEYGPGVTCIDFNTSIISPNFDILRAYFGEPLIGQSSPFFGWNLFQEDFANLTLMLPNNATYPNQTNASNTRPMRFCGIDINSILENPETLSIWENDQLAEGPTGQSNPLTLNEFFDPWAPNDTDTTSAKNYTQSESSSASSYQNLVVVLVFSLLSLLV